VCECVCACVCVCVIAVMHYLIYESRVTGVKDDVDERERDGEIEVTQRRERKEDSKISTRCKEIRK